MAKRAIMLAAIAALGTVPMVTQGTAALATLNGIRPGSAPNCNLGPFTVYFGYDQNELPDDAPMILDNALVAARNCGNSRVMLSGHTDRVGSREYNLTLGERRNAIVKAYLLERGVAAERIVTVSYGEERPVILTEDEVHEPRNNRVEVTFSPGSGM